MDERPEGEVSSQRHVQIRRHMLGLCIICSAPAVMRQRCVRHNLYDKLRAAGITKGKLNKEQASRREKLASNLAGRYAAIHAGFLQPGTREETLAEAADLVDRLNLEWGGRFRVAGKLATIMRLLDNHALKHREVKP